MVYVMREWWSMYVLNISLDLFQITVSTKHGTKVRKKYVNNNHIILLVILLTCSFVGKGVEENQTTFVEW